MAERREVHNTKILQQFELIVPDESVMPAEHRRERGNINLVIGLIDDVRCFGWEGLTDPASITVKGFDLPFDFIREGGCKVGLG